MDDSTKKNTITNTNYFMHKIYFFLVLLFAVNGVWGKLQLMEITGQGLQVYLPGVVQQHGK